MPYIYPAGSLTWITDIKFTPKYYDITASGGTEFTTDDDYLKAAAGEEVKVNIADKNPTDSILMAGTGDGKFVRTSASDSIDDADFPWAFTMPKGAVTLFTVPVGTDLSDYEFIDDADPNAPLYGDDRYTPEQGTAKMVEVSFAANDGTAAENTVTVAVGQKYGALPVPKRTGYTFIGWYTASVNGVEVTADTVVSNMDAHVLYAHWEKSTIKASAVKKPAAVKVRSVKNKAKK